MFGAAYTQLLIIAWHSIKRFCRSFLQIIETYVVGPDKTNHINVGGEFGHVLKVQAPEVITQCA